MKTKEEFINEVRLYCHDAEYTDRSNSIWIVLAYLDDPETGRWETTSTRTVKSKSPDDPPEYWYSLVVDEINGLMWWRHPGSTGWGLSLDVLDIIIFTNDAAEVMAVFTSLSEGGDLLQGSDAASYLKNKGITRDAD